jgi:hypothetical protein
MNTIEKDPALVAAWEECDARTVSRLLQEKHVPDHMYLLESGILNAKGKPSPFKIQRLPGCLRVFMKTAIKQHVERAELEKIYYACWRVACECDIFGDSFHHDASLNV